jgi:hypothetical protein
MFFTGAYVFLYYFKVFTSYPDVCGVTMKLVPRYNMLGKSREVTYKEEHGSTGFNNFKIHPHIIQAPVNEFASVQKDKM